MREPSAQGDSPVRSLSRAALRKEVARADLLELSKGMRSRMMANVKDMIKSLVLEDPDMWKCARSITSTAVDQILHDVEHEVENSLESAVLLREDDADTEGPQGESLLLRSWYSARAHLLRHYMPYNKSMYGQLKDPWYLLMYVAILGPVHGLRVVFFSVVLLALLFPGPPDQYQLINFILVFKGMQFLTSGAMYTAAGAMHYFACYSYHKGELLQCIDASGPGASTSFGQLVDYLGSILLVWVTFFALPSSRKHMPKSLVGSNCESPGCDTGMATHWRLRRLLHYDMVCFALSILVLGMLTASNCGDVLTADQAWWLLGHPQFRANVYWSCVLYSLLSLPFALFTVPGLRQVLTHSGATGYNEHGACVGHCLSPPKPEQGSGLQPEVGYGLDLATSLAARALRVASRGRVARGGEEHGEHLPGDFRRGLWLSLAAPLTTGNSRAASALEAPPRQQGSFASLPWTRSFRGHRQGASGQAGEDAGLLPGIPGGRAPEMEGGDSGLFGGLGAPAWALRPFSTRLLGGLESRGGSPMSRFLLDGPLPAISVRVVPDGTGQREGGVMLFRVEVLADRTPSRSLSEPWHVMRRHADFAKLAERLSTCTARGSPGGGAAAIEPLPRLAATVGCWPQVEVPGHELGAWLEGLLRDARSHGVWAAELRDFWGLGSEPAYAAPPAPAGAQGEQQCGGPLLEPSGADEPSYLQAAAAWAGTWMPCTDA